MPIVQAYKCPKTRKLFEDKSKYVEHLKKLARENLRNKDDHFRLTILERKFDALRMTANSFEDIGKWLEAHPRMIRDLSIRFDNRSGKVGKEKPRLSDFTFDDIKFDAWLGNERHRPIHGVYRSRPDSATHHYYPGVSADIRYNCSDDIDLSDVIEHMLQIRAGSGGTGHFTDYRYEITFFAEDWPFVGAHFLFSKLNSDVIDDYHKRILKYAFPAMPEERYLSLRSAGLLPDDAVSFKDFMMQFTGYRRTNEPKLGISLPNTLGIEII